MKDSKKSIHGGHRARIREKYKNSGFDSFSDYEMLEILLYSVQSRRNTNDIAHVILDNFGSLRDVLNATREELLELPDVGDGSAMIINAVSELMRRYYAASDVKERFNTIDKVGEFFAHKYIGVGVETLYVLLLDNSLGFIDCQKIHEGSISSASFELNKVYRYAYSKKAANVIIAHNHPGGILVPSESDKVTTQLIYEGLGLLGINLIEHFIVTGNRYLPLMRNSEILSLKRNSENMLAFEKVEYMTGKSD